MRVLPTAPRRLLTLVAVGASAVLVLSGCSLFGSKAAPSASPKPSRSSSASAAPSQSAAPSTTPTPEATPVTISCDQLLTAQQLYDFNPNFGTAPGYAPKSGSPEADAVAAKGISCGWQNQTSGSIIEIALAHPAASALTTLSGTAAEQSNPVPTYGTAPEVTGYFSPDGGVAQVFAKGYWIVVASTDFLEPGDAAQPVADVIANLP